MYHFTEQVDFKFFRNKLQSQRVKPPHSFTLLHSHHWIQYTSDNYLKQTSDYRQARKSLPGKKIATGHESAKERENHHKQNIVAEIQVY